MLISICLFIFNFSSPAQTKLISFKSHSGNTSNFRKAVENDLFDIGNSNFGLVIKYTNTIDSVVNKNGLVTVYQKISYQDGQKITSNFKKETLSQEDSKAIIHAKSLDDIKTKLKIKFTTSKVDSLKLIGFNIRKAKKKE